MATGFPARYTWLSPPGYPVKRKEDGFEVQVNLTRNERIILITGTEYHPDLHPLYDEIESLTKRIQAEGVTDEESAAMQARGTEIEAEVAALKAIARQRYGTTMSRAFNSKSYTFHGVAFDFSTPDAALATLENLDLPDDIRAWLLNVPAGATEAEAERIEKNCTASSLAQMLSDDSSE